MGFISKIRGFFDTGGIKVKLDAPRSFSWHEDQLDVVVTLTGNKEKPTSINSLKFTVRSLPPSQQQGGTAGGNSGPSKSSFTFDWDHPVDIQLDANEVRDVPVMLMLPKPSGVAKAPNAPDIMSSRWEAMREHNRCELNVSAKVDGARFSRGSSRQLRVSDSILGGIRFRRQEDEVPEDPGGAEASPY